MHYFALSGHQLKCSLAKMRQLVGLDPCYVCSTYVKRQLLFRRLPKTGLQPAHTADSRFTLNNRPVQGLVVEKLGPAIRRTRSKMCTYHYVGPLVF